MPKLEVEGVGTFDVEGGKRLVLAIEEDADVDIMHVCGSYARPSGPWLPRTRDSLLPPARWLSSAGRLAVPRSESSSTRSGTHRSHRRAQVSTRR